MADGVVLNTGTGGDTADALDMGAGVKRQRVLSLQNLVTVTFDITRPANTTVYAVDDAFSDHATTPVTGGNTFTGAARISGGSGIVLDAWFVSSNDPATKLLAELCLFNQAFTHVGDNLAFAVTDAEAKTCVGIIPFTMQDFGNNQIAHARNLSIGFTCVGTANLRAMVRVKNAYTPASGEVLTCTLKIMQVD